jgi:hypothetical protein
MSANKPGDTSTGSPTIYIRSQSVNTYRLNFKKKKRDASANYIPPSSSKVKWYNNNKNPLNRRLYSIVWYTLRPCVTIHQNLWKESVLWRRRLIHTQLSHLAKHFFKIFVVPRFYRFIIRRRKWRRERVPLNVFSVGSYRYMLYTTSSHNES